MVAVDYKVIKNFFNKNELKVYQKYCFNKLDESKNYDIDKQSFSPAWYKDCLMNSLLDEKLSIVERESNLKLFPTYAYWRYYIFGANLKQHTDRPSCEISITACVKKYDNWPLIIEGEKIELNEGDGLLYAGCEQKHGRPGIYKGEGMAQVFFHYVNQNGPHRNHAYDVIQKNNEF
jgi:hypothetical protein